MRVISIIRSMEDRRYTFSVGMSLQRIRSLARVPFFGGSGSSSVDAASIALHQTLLRVACEVDSCGTIDLLDGAAAGPGGRAALLIDHGSQLQANVRFSASNGPGSSGGLISLRAPNSSIEIVGNGDPSIPTIDTSVLLDSATGAAGVVEISAARMTSIGEQRNTGYHPCCGVQLHGGIS